MIDMIVARSYLQLVYQYLISNTCTPFIYRYALYVQTYTQLKTTIDINTIEINRYLTSISIDVRRYSRYQTKHQLIIL